MISIKTFYNEIIFVDFFNHFFFVNILSSFLPQNETIHELFINDEYLYSPLQQCNILNAFLLMILLMNVIIP